MTNYYKLLLGVISIAIILCSSMSYAENWSVEFDNRLGASKYQEEIPDLNIKSNWDGIYYKGIVAAEYFKEGSIVGRIDFGMPVTAVREEAWTVSGSQVQTNDMRFWGIDQNVELGYAAPIIEGKLTLTPLIGYGFSFIRFSRTNFLVFGNLASTVTVDEDYWIHHVDLGVRLDTKISDRWGFNIKSLFGFVVYNAVKNSILGTVDGDGGHILKTEASIDYDTFNKWVISLGAFFDVQSLQGGTSGNIIWPDNDLYSYGATLSLKYVF